MERDPLATIGVGGVRKWLESAKQLEAERDAARRQAQWLAELCAARVAGGPSAKAERWLHEAAEHTQRPGGAEPQPVAPDEERQL
jgi:hypothetical protein